jgi:hypothetical protein
MKTVSFIALVLLAGLSTACAQESGAASAAASTSERPDDTSTPSDPSRTIWECRDQFADGGRTVRVNRDQFGEHGITVVQHDQFSGDSEVGFLGVKRETISSGLTATEAYGAVDLKSQRMLTLFINIRPNAEQLDGHLQLVDAGELTILDLSCQRLAE